MPPKDEYISYLEGIWHRNWLTNMGPLSSRLEMELKNYLNLAHLLFVTNGTIALQMAIKSLDLKGEIITTPFSFVATTSSIVWENCNPIFVDIEKDTFNIDPKKIESAITKKTTAILATHVYGNPCKVEEIDEIARKHNLKVIYDGAHAFGVKYKDRSLFEYGDISVCSLHATKFYHSIEGGLVITKNPELLKKLAYIRNFGFDGPEKFAEIGINAKNSEFHAAMGLVNIKHLDFISDKRKQLSNRYDEKLITLKVRKPIWNKYSNNNYAYYPIVFENEQKLLKSMEDLALKGIFTRRYFYPSLSNSLPYIKKTKFEICDDIAKKVLCLPLYTDLTIEEVDLICRLLLRTQNN